MNDEQLAAGQVRFFTLVGSEAGARLAHLTIDSLRAFGGPLRACPVQVFVHTAAPEAAAPVSAIFADLADVALVPLELDEAFRYPFAAKVYAAARAEALAGPDTRAVVWLGPSCLVVNPPRRFALGPAHDAALRAVHIQNVGSLASAPPDPFWQAIYRAVGVGEVPFTVESFVDGQRLRPYFNSHCLASNPASGLLGTWWEYFQGMATDRSFQAGPCQDELHQIFLHQAILSALVTKWLDPRRIDQLPADYSYPLHFQEQVPPAHRATALDHLTCPVYEEAGDLSALPAGEPLRSWLAARGVSLPEA
jgi:hypothetical protein